MNLEEENDNYFLSVVVALLLVFAFFYMLRKYIKGKQYTESTKATDKIIIITGANTGIGKQLSRELNIRKGKIYMFCRDEEKAFDAKVSLTKYGCDATRFITIKCDLTSIASIKNAVVEFKKHESCLDVLINNAGVSLVPKFTLTEDNCEVTWQTNYLGHFVLTELLLPLLEKSKGGRIINVSSYLQAFCHEIDLEKINDKSYFGPLKSYNMSKLAQILHAKELTRRIREKNPSSKVTINSCEPGVVNTDLMRNTFLEYDIIKKVTKPFRWFFLKTAQDGAQCPLYLVLSTTVDGISEICGMRARSDSAIIRARYSSEVSGVNRFRHFHTPISLSNKQKNNLDMPSFYQNLPLLDKKIKKSSRVLLDIAKPCQECSESSQKDTNSHLPCLILHPKNRHISRDIVTVASDFNFYDGTYKNKSTSKKEHKRSNVILSEDSLASNRTIPNASDYESGISKSSSFSNNSSILSPNSNLTIMENSKHKSFGNDTNFLLYNKMAKTDGLLKVSNSKTMASNRISLSSSSNGTLSKKFSHLNNNELYTNNEGLSIDKIQSKPFLTKQGKKNLKSFKYEMRSFSSDNIVVVNKRKNDQFDENDNNICYKLEQKFFTENGTQTDKVRFKRDKSGLKKQKKKKSDSSILTLDSSIQTEPSKVLQITKAVQTSFIQNKGYSFQTDVDYADEYYHLDLFNEFTKALSQTIDRESRKYLSHHILSSIKEKGEAWKDAKKFVSSVLIPQSVSLANKTQYNQII